MAPAARWESSSEKAAPPPCRAAATRSAEAARDPARPCGRGPSRRMSRFATYESLPPPPPTEGLVRVRFFGLLARTQGGEFELREPQVGRSRPCTCESVRMRTAPPIFVALPPN